MSNTNALAGLADRRMVELDLEGELVALVRLEARPLQRGALAFADLDRLLHAQEALRRVLQLDAGALQQEHERRRRAVEDRHLLGGDVDDAGCRGRARRRPTAGARPSSPSAPPGSPSADSVVAMRVSLTANASTLIVDRRGRSTRRNTMPVSGGAGRSVSSTRWPPCTPDADGAGQRLERALGQHAAELSGRCRRDRAARPFAAATASCAGADRRSIGLLAQERRDLDLVHAVARQRIDLGRRGAAVAPDARRRQAAVVVRSAAASAPAGSGPAGCRCRCAASPARCAPPASAAACARRAGLRPVAITVTRSWSPSDSS